MKYGDLSTFFGGLEAKIGPPLPKIQEGMEAEHTAASDSLDYFTTGNYGVTTTPTLARLLRLCPPPRWPAARQPRTRLPRQEPHARACHPPGQRHASRQAATARPSYRG